MKRHTLSFLLLFVALSCAAVPALRKKHNIQLVSGATISATLQGDETLHYFEDDHGNIYQANAEGLYQSVTRAQLSEQRQAKMKRIVLREQGRKVRRHAAAKKAFTGKKHCLVILANFSDLSMTYTKEDYEQFFNELGYNKYGMQGSVRDYFLACSYGKLDIEFDIVGPIQLKKSVTYYGSNDSHGGDRHPGAMVTEALKAAEAAGADFSKYDWDGNGEVEQVFVIYAGYGEAQSANATDIWPHEDKLSVTGGYGDGAVQNFDGVKIDTYATSCELEGRKGTEIDGIGTACHEFSHCMGLPDTYDTVNGTNFSMDVWDVMDYGNYNGVGGKQSSCPWEFTSYERWMCGWLTPTELKDGCEVRNMPPLNETPEAYIIYNEANRNEYYLLENRQQQGFDAGGYGHGMIVIHVDYDKTAWAKNALNIEKDHQRMTIIPADGSSLSLISGIACVKGDPYPGTKKNTMLTNTSAPKALLYNANSDGKKLMNKPITNITEDGTLISFTFNGGGTVIDGIQETNNEVDNGSSHSLHYDLNGRPVTHWHRGISINNGKLTYK